MLITVETTCPHVFFLTSIKVIKNDEICVEVAFLPHKHLTMCRLTWLSSYMYISTIGNYCMTGSRYHYEYYKTI